VVSKHVYKSLLEIVSFEALALGPNLLMHFETEDSTCLRLLLKTCFIRLSLLKFYWCLRFILIVWYVPRYFHKGHFRKVNSAG